MNTFCLRPGSVAFIALIYLSFFACKESATTDVISDFQPADIKLESLPASATGIDFINQVNDTGRVNIFTWHFIYNGAGVAAGDINNDGLVDLYFTGSMVQDRLYINKGNFQFEDITATAGISSRLWSSGVTMADVNGDGLLDIYVCKNSPTAVEENNRNVLYINQGKNVFKEQAQQYGLADIGFGVQATFFDLDQDNDLDMFLVNQPFDEFARLVNRPEVVAAYPKTDRIFINENGKFSDHTQAMGLNDDRYGLNVSLGDFDLNGWTDLYVCNDYHHGDRYYLNFNGKLKESSVTHAGHISFYSMGSDVADVNNDGWLDLITLDMAFEDHYRSKTNMGSMQPDRFWALVREGQHYQYMQNMLQVNMGNGYFSEQGQIAGVNKSDWSYAALFADLDHDSDQDLMITNGILRDLRNNDFQVFVREKYQNQVGPENYKEVLSHIPSTPIKNVLYSNDGKGHFTKMPPEAAFGEGNYSHGMAVADLDNDGQLDVVINNMNSPASVCKNATASKGNYVAVRLQGPGDNSHGLGCTVIAYSGDQKQINTMQTTRGYFSSSDPVIHFGLAGNTIDSVKVIWNHQEMSVVTDLTLNATNVIAYKKAKKVPFQSFQPIGIDVNDADVVDHQHWEDEFNDYGLQVLIPYKESQNGPFIAAGDINGDQREDFFIGGAAGKKAIIYVQGADGKFTKTTQPALDADKACEDLEAQFFDSDNDGDLDLIVCSGSYEFYGYAQGKEPATLQARLYINDGAGQFTKAPVGTFPDVRINGQAVEIFDADGDNDPDIFISGRLTGGKYPLPTASILLINDKGKFSHAQNTKELSDADGLVTDAEAVDIDGDGDVDLLLAGEWMAPVWMINNGKGGFSKQVIDLPLTGLWWTLAKGDFDEDGDLDFIAGNLGWNNKFGGAKGTKLEVYATDFDKNGDFDVVLASQKQDKLLPVRGRECSSQEMPFILDKFPTYESYASADLKEILSPDLLETSWHNKLSTMSSVMLINDGNMKFSMKELPATCQAGPIKAFYVDDYNQDGHFDFIYGGNHFPTEVETARYDALYPGICYGDGKGGFECRTIFVNGQLCLDDIRDIQKIKGADGEAVYLFSNNDGPLRSYKIPAVKPSMR